MKTGITGDGTRDAGTSEFSNLKTGTLETGITGGFPKWVFGNTISRNTKRYRKIRVK
jgi:hypothetical protein